MKTFTVNGVNYIGVEVPALHMFFKISGNQLITSRHTAKVNDLIKKTDLPQGNYEIIGMVKDLKLPILKDLSSKNGAFVALAQLKQIMKEYNLTDNTLIIKVI